MRIKWKVCQKRKGVRVKEIGCSQTTINLEDYKTCLFEKREIHRRMKVFRSRKHDVYTKEINKIDLSPHDDKRVILDDGVCTHAYGFR